MPQLAVMECGLPGRAKTGFGAKRPSLRRNAIRSAELEAVARVQEAARAAVLAREAGERQIDLFIRVWAVIIPVRF